MDDMVRKAEEGARRAEEAALRAAQSRRDVAMSSFKKARIEPDQASRGNDTSDAQKKLQEAIQRAMSSMASSLLPPEKPQPSAEPSWKSQEGGGSHAAPSAPERAASSTNPGAMYAAAATQESRHPLPEPQRQWAPMKESQKGGTGEDTVVYLRKHMQWMNRECGFKATLEVEKVLKVAQYVEFGFNMKVLKDLEEKKARVNDPTAYVCAALRRVAGNESSPYNVEPSKSSTAAESQQDNGMAASSKVSQLVLAPHFFVQDPKLQQAYMLAEHAEECAKTASSAAAMYKTNANAAPEQLQALLDTTTQAADRVSWAVGWIDSYMPPAHPTQAAQNPELDPKDQWMESVREIIKDAAELAAASSKVCTQW